MLLRFVCLPVFIAQIRLDNLALLWFSIKIMLRIFLCYLKSNRFSHISSKTKTISIYSIYPLVKTHHFTFKQQLAAIAQHTFSLGGGQMRFKNPFTCPKLTALPPAHTLINNGVIIIFLFPLHLKYIFLRTCK